MAHEKFLIELRVINSSNSSIKVKVHIKERSTGEVDRDILCGL